MGMAHSSHGEKMNAHRILVGNYRERERPVGRLRRRREDNIKMDPRERGWYIMGWIYLAQDKEQ
jgi:hypothetical protein